MPMDQTTMLIAASCLALAALVYLMWRSAMQEEWRGLTHEEKRRWRIDEEKIKEAGATSAPKQEQGRPQGKKTGARK